MATILEKHTKEYWEAISTARHGLALSRVVSINTDLPNLLIKTPFQSLKTKISKELQNVKSTKSS